MKRMVGAAVFVLGLELVGWVGYNLLVERSPYTRNLPLLPCIILSPGCLFVGFRWMRGRAAWPRLARALKDLFVDPLTHLSSHDPAEVQHARQALLTYDFLKMDLSRLYEAIQKPWADDGDEVSGTRGLLLRCLWKTHNAGTVDFIRDVFLVLPENRDIRFAALSALGIIDTPESLTVMLDLLQRNTPHLGRYIGTLFRQQHATRRHADVLFPQLFMVLPSLEYRHEAYRLAISYRDHRHAIASYREAVETKAQDTKWSRTIDAAIQSAARQILADYDATIAIRPDPGKDYDAYGDHVETLCTLLNVMSSLPADPEVATILRHSLGDESPQVVIHAARSLRRIGKEVPAETINRIAAFGVKRPTLVEVLKQGAGTVGDVLPPSYPPRSQEIEINSKYLDLEFNFRPSLRIQTVVGLVRELPLEMALTFYDPGYPSSGDPGGYFSIRRHVDAYSINFSNRFWSTHSWWIDEGTLIRYIWGCRSSHIRDSDRTFPPNEEQILLGPLFDPPCANESRSVDDEPSAEFSRRLLSMPLVI